MSMNGLHASVHLGIKNGIGKVPIQPTPGAIRKPPNTKPKQRKSRTGCMTCKAKRLKCDERKPFCDQCTKKGIQCEGYAKNFKWKSFEDIQEQKKNAPVRRKSSVVSKPEDDGNEMNDYEFNVKPEYVRSPAELMPPPRGPGTHNSVFSVASFGNSPGWNEYASPNGFTNGFNNTPPYNNNFLSPRSEPSPKMSITSILCDPNDPNVYTPPQYERISPRSDQVQQPAETIPETAPPVVETVPLVTRTPPPLSFIPVMWKDYEFHPSDESDVEEEDETVEELSRESFIESDALIPSPKRRRLNSYIPSDSYDLHAPYRDMEMWDFYDKVTCKILSCKNAQGENPWRDDLIQRASVSDPLKHALFAMTSFHMKQYHPDEAWMRSNHGLSYTNAAFRALRQVMSDGKAFADENNIAAMLVLSFSQVWDDPRLDGRTHVLGASKILEKQLRELTRKRKPAAPFLRFLYNTWLYLDVLSSLSSGEDPYALKFYSSSMSPPPSPATIPGTSPSGEEKFSLRNEIDALLGCAGDLFPLIARMSKVCNRLNDKVITLSEIPFIEDAIQVRDDLLDWKAPAISTLQESSDVHCSLYDIVRTAEVYRLTALLHLYRAFPPLGKDIQSLADQILNSLLLIPNDSGSLCIHIWPLMAAGCEHTENHKRQLVLQRFEVVREKLRVANVDQVICLLKEVWNRRDSGDFNAGWASLARERDWHLLLG